MSSGRLKIALNAEELLVIQKTLWATLNHSNTGCSKEQRMKIHKKIKTAFQECEVKMVREPKKNGAYDGR